MSQIIIFPGDERRYYRYKKGQRVYVRCAEKKEDENGNTLSCSYQDVREDNHKDRKTLHICKFVSVTSTNMITNYYQKEERQPAPEFSTENLINHIALVAGKKFTLNIT